MLATQVLKLKVNISANQAMAFRKTQEHFVAACNMVSQYIFDHDFILKQRTLQDRLYYRIRANFDMPSFLAQSVIKTVIAKYKTVKTLNTQKLAKQAKQMQEDKVRLKLMLDKALKNYNPDDYPSEEEMDNIIDEVIANEPFDGSLERDFEEYNMQFGNNEDNS